MSVPKDKEELDEEPEQTLQEVFDTVWFKFVEWSSTQAKQYLPSDLATLIDGGIRRPPMLALITINDLLRKREEGEGGREQVENRRKIIEEKDVEQLKAIVKTTVTFEGWPFPPEIEQKFFQYAKVMLDLVDQLNEV